MLYAKNPCAECPWRRDVPPGKFPPERFIALAHTAYDLAGHVFACHQWTPIPLFADYRKMAIANGVPRSHHCLRNCRTDGQR